MKLRHIEIFNALMRTGSVSAAARRLNLSQPGVTRILSHAESSLGVRLFERHPRGLTPTPEAQRLWPGVESMVEQLEALSQLETRLRHGVDQHLRLGASHALGHSILPKALIDLQREMPSLAVELATSHFSTLCEELLTHRLDLALAFEQPIPEGIEGETLVRAPLSALLPRDLDAPDRIDLAWLWRHDLIAMPEEDPIGRLVHQAILAEGLPGTSARLRIKTYSVIAEMVIAGGGTGLVDPFTAERYRDRLQVVPLVPAVEMSVTLLRARHVPRSHAACRLSQLIRDRLLTSP